MFFYYSFLSIAAFFSFLEIQKGKKTNSKYLFIILSIVLFLLSFLRWENGTDWDMYYDLYGWIDWGGFWIIEPIFASIMVLTKYILGHFTFLLFFCGAILFFFQTNSILKYSIYPLTTLYILVGMQFGNVMFVRQTIAISLILFSIRYIMNKSLFKFIICIFIAMGFHYTAIVFFPAYFLFHINLTKRKMIILPLIAFLLSAIMTGFLSFLGNMIGGALLYKVQLYIDEGHQDNTNLSPFFLLVKSLFNRGIIYLIGFYLYYKTPKRSLFRGFFNLYVAGTLVYFIMSPISNVLTRCSLYYDISQIFIIPYIFIFSKHTKQRFLFWNYLTILLVLKLYFYISSYYELYIPFNITPLI